MDNRQFGALIRAVRVRRQLRQKDLADAAGVARSTISEVENGNLGRLSIETLRRIAEPLQVQFEVRGWWRGGDGQRLLSRRHSRLAESFAAFIGDHSGWHVEPEVSFSVYGERGVIDQLAWHAATMHLLVIELKTEFVDINEMLGTLDRKVRLARTIAVERGWRPNAVSAWLVVADSRTNRRHAAEHRTLLDSRFRSDGRSLRAFLRNPTVPATGMTFWTDANGSDASPEGFAAVKAVQPHNAATRRPG